jgi:glycerol uptake facilitator-like aquaporin
LWLVGAVPATRCVCVFIAQMLGGIAAAAAVSATFPGPLTVNVRLGGGTSVSQGLFIEMFATTQLVLTVIMLAAVKHKATYLAPIGIGIALFIGNLCSKQNPSSTFTAAMWSNPSRCSRHLLLWGRHQSYPCLWTGRCESLVPWLSLDILAWSRPRITSGRILLLRPRNLWLDNRKSGPEL